MQRCKFGGHAFEAIRNFVGKAMLKRNGFSFDVAQISESLEQ